MSEIQHRYPSYFVEVEMVKNILSLILVTLLLAYVVPPFIFNDYKLKSAKLVAIDLVVLPILYLFWGGRQK
ncbi:hypothetical protein IJ00_23525 [Calothrix sp. 336/3]|nr:hypothetical protein IJ00_23525 [Calothrix sp. 336/3]